MTVGLGGTGHGLRPDQPTMFAQSLQQLAWDDKENRKQGLFLLSLI